MHTISRAIFTAILVILSFTTAIAQEHTHENRKRHFSPEEFQSKQRKYIANKAELTPEEADAFFPIFFELQKEKFQLEREARKDINKKFGEKMSEEQCIKFVNNMADLKIEIAKLEKKYNEKYLKVISACKLMRIQKAEHSFQRDLMKKITRNRDNKRK